MSSAPSLFPLYSVLNLLMCDFFKKSFYLFTYLFWAVLGLCCCAQAFSGCGKQGLPFIAVCSLPVVAASLVAEPRLQGAWASVVAAPGLKSTGSIAVVHRHSCSTAYGIFPDQGSNLCPLSWQADSYPLHHQGSPILNLFFLLLLVSLSSGQLHLTDL